MGEDALSGKATDWQILDLAKLPVGSMALSSRACNCLLQCGCTHVGDVIALSSDAILRMRNLGPKTESEIARWLIEHEILGSAWSEFI